MNLSAKQLHEKGWQELPDGSWTRNPGGAVEAAKPQQDKGALGEGTRPDRESESSLGHGAFSKSDRFICVELTSHLRRKMDDDNLIGGFKPLRDCISRTLGIDDGDPRLRFFYHQHVSNGPETTTVRVWFS